MNTSGFLFLTALAGLSVAPWAIAREDRVEMSVAVCNLAKVKHNGLAAAQAETARIFSHAGLQVRWIETESNCAVHSRQPYFLVIIMAGAPKGWTSGPHEMGLALRADSYHRAYIFYDRLNDMATSVKLMRDIRADVDVVLGHAIAHELGHLLLHGKGPSSGGIMREQWDYGQWTEASAGRLLFEAEDAEWIRDELLRNAH